MGKAFVGAFIGRIIAALFIAACVVLGFGPAEWAQMILGIETVWIARSIFLAVGTATAVALVAPLLMRGASKADKEGPSKIEIAKAIDELFAEGVRHRNALQPALWQFDYENEHAKFSDWDARVLATLDDRFVAMREKSRFRTLDRFQPEFRDVPGKDPNQAHLESMWNEKLSRLQIIIGKIGS